MNKAANLTWTTAPGFITAAPVRTKNPRKVAVMSAAAVYRKDGYSKSVALRYAWADTRPSMDAALLSVIILLIVAAYYAVVLP